MICETLFAHMTFHEVGSHCDESALSRMLGPYTVTAEQCLQLRFLYEEIAQSCRLTPEVGRGAASLEAHVKSHEASLAEAHDVNDAIAKLANTVARPVDPARAKIPACASQVRPEEHLSPEKAHLFCHQDRLVVRPEPPGRLRRCMMISPENELALRQRLLEAGAGCLWPVDEVPCEGGAPLLAGWFAVPHSEAAD